MLRGCAKNRLLVGIGKAQHFLLDLGRGLAAQQAIARAGEVAAVVVELGQDFAQLCLPTTIGADRIAKPRIRRWYRP